MASVSCVMPSVFLRQKLVIVSNAEVLLLEQILHTNCSACEYSVYQAVNYKVLRALLKISVISIALQCMASDFSSSMDQEVLPFCSWSIASLCSIRAQQ